MLKKVLLIGICLALLLSNLLAVYVARHYYGQARQYAVFPDYRFRYQADNQRLVEQDSQLKSLILFGDSRIEQWSPKLKLDEYSVIYRGVGGETTAQMRHRYDQDVLSLMPRIVVIQAGINDLVAAGSLPDKSDRIVEATAENIRQMAGDAAVQGAKVLLLSIVQPASPPIYRRIVWSSAIEGYVDSVNSDLERFASQTDGVTFVDVNSMLETGSSEFERRYAADTLHLNETAYSQLNNEISRLVQSVNGL